MAKKDIPFNQDTARYFLPWMSGLMVFIAVLFLVAGFKAHNMLDVWRIGVQGSITVQVPTHDIDGSQRKTLDNDIERALTVLRASDGIVGAQVISNDDMNNLMAPWVGAQVDVASLPVPKIIDVFVDVDNLPNLTVLKQQLAEQVPSAILDGHRIWLDSFLRLANLGVNLICFVLVLLVLTVSFTLVYSTKSSLSVHTSVISLLHMIGAGDFYISTQYAWRNFKLTFMGGILGYLIAYVVVFFVGQLTHSIMAEFYGITGLSTHQWVGVITLPLIIAVMAFVTTYITVNNYLKRFL